MFANGHTSSMRSDRKSRGKYSMASSTALFSIESLFRRIFVSFSVEYSLTILYGKYKLLLIKEQGQELFSRPCFYKTFSIEMINPNYMTHLDNVVRIIITWSECNYRIWKNPVISMVLAHQARGFYPNFFSMRLESYDKRFFQMM